MISSLPSRTLTVGALILSMVTVALLLALTPRAVAQWHRTACPASAAAQLKRSVRACAQSKHTPKASHKRKAHAHLKGKGQHKHAVSNAKPPAAATTKAANAKPPAGTNQIPATCENGSLPIRSGNGYFSCADGSEPGCENGTTPALSSNGGMLLCEAEPSPGPTPVEATCEDRSIPLRAADGSFSCDDESAPGCENGSAPTLSSDHSTLVCNVIVDPTS